MNFSNQSIYCYNTFFDLYSRLNISKILFIIIIFVIVFQLKMEQKKKSNSPKLKSILRNKNDHSPLLRAYTKNSYYTETKEIEDLCDLETGDISVYNPKAKSVSQYAYEERKNKKYRNTMEDFNKIIDRIGKDPNKGYFSLFDGHGGTEVVDYIRERLYSIFISLYNKDSNNITKCFTKAFEIVDGELKKFPHIENIGATGTVVFILKETDVMFGTKKVAYCANVGDTRAVVLNSSGCKRLSYDHKCNDLFEVERIKKSGGNIVQDRVLGKLALTRTFGDYAMKTFGVTATPSVNRMVLNDSDKYIVICSDGVWDVIDEEDMFYNAFQFDDAKEFAEKIVEDSISKGSTDNISCIVIKL